MMIDGHISTLYVIVNSHSSILTNIMRYILAIANISIAVTKNEYGKKRHHVKLNQMFQHIHYTIVRIQFLNVY